MPLMIKLLFHHHLWLTTSSAADLQEAGFWPVINR